MSNKILKLNYLGLKCPLPVLKAYKVLKNIDSNSLVEVFTADPNARKDFKNLCEKNSFVILKTRKENKVLCLLIKKV